LRIELHVAFKEMAIVRVFGTFRRARRLATHGGTVAANKQRERVGQAPASHSHLGRY
jgi:hypothetical protein